MAYSKTYLLSEAIKITVAYARGGGNAPRIVLKNIFDQLKELNEEIEKEGE